MRDGEAVGDLHRVLVHGACGRAARLGWGAAGATGCSPPGWRRTGREGTAALTQQRPDDPRRALVAPLEAVHDGGEHDRVQPHHAAAGERAREGGRQRSGRGWRCRGGGRGRRGGGGCVPRRRGGGRRRALRWGGRGRSRSRSGSCRRHFARERGGVVRAGNNWLIWTPVTQCYFSIGERGALKALLPSANQSGENDEGRLSDWRKSTLSVTEAESCSHPLGAGKFFDWVLASPASLRICSPIGWRCTQPSVCQGGKAYLLAVAVSVTLSVARWNHGLSLSAVPSTGPARQPWCCAGLRAPLEVGWAGPGVPELPVAFQAPPPQGCCCTPGPASAACVSPARVRLCFRPVLSAVGGRWGVWAAAVSSWLWWQGHGCPLSLLLVRVEAAVLLLLSYSCVVVWHRAAMVVKKVMQPLGYWPCEAGKGC